MNSDQNVADSALAGFCGRLDPQFAADGVKIVELFRTRTFGDRVDYGLSVLISACLTDPAVRFGITELVGIAVISDNVSLN